MNRMHVSRPGERRENPLFAFLVLVLLVADVVAWLFILAAAMPPVTP